MADSFIGIDEPATIDKKADTEQLVVGANTVERERIQIVGAAALEIARVINSDAAGTEYAGVVRPASPTPNRTATGTLNALNAAVTMSAQGIDSAAWEIDTGTLVGTVVFEATLDDTNWPFALNSIRIDGTIISSTSTFADRGKLVGAGGYSQIRLRVSAFTSGSSAARMEASLGGDIVRLGQAIPPGANNIGDVDVLTVPAPLSTTGGGTEATALRVTVANDSTGLLSVDDNAGSLTVDGTVTANAGTGNFNVVGTKSNNGGAPGTTNLGTLPAVANAAAPTQTEGNQVALRTNLAGDVAVTLDGESVTIGTFPDNEPFNVAQIGGTATVNGGVAGSLAVGGHTAHDAAEANNPVSISGVAETPDDSVPTNQVSAEGDRTRLATDRDGALYTHPHPPRIWHASNEYTTAQTDTVVKAAPAAGLSLYITDIYLAVNAAVNVTLEEGTTVFKWKYYGSGQGDGASVNFTTPLKLTAATQLAVTTSGAVNVTLVVSGFTAP